VIPILFGGCLARRLVLYYIGWDLCKEKREKIAGDLKNFLATEDAESTEER